MTGAPAFPAFVAVWLGQSVSFVGSAMTAFAVGLWVLERTGSTTAFAMIAFFGTLPGLMALPLAGVVVDRMGPRRAMLLADAGEGLATLSMAGLFFCDRLAIWEVWVFTMVAALFGALRWPAFSTLPTLLVPRHRLSRANGMVQMAEAIATVLAPVAGGSLVSSVGLGAVLVIDAVTFAIGCGTLAFVRTEKPLGMAADTPEARGSLRSEWSYGWRYIRARPGLVAMLAFFAVTNFTVLGLARTLFTPLILGFASPRVLGTLLSAGGLGFVVGAAIMSAWGGPKRRVHGILGFTLVQGLAVAISGLRPSAVLVGFALFMVSFCFPLVAGSSQALWQSKVPIDVQGRVFSVRRLLGWSAFPVAYLVAGPLADHLFEPLLRSDGPLAYSVGRLIGVGGGRGIALLFVLLGLLTVVAVVVSYRSERLRLLEDELPDAVMS